MTLSVPSVLALLLVSAGAVVPANVSFTMDGPSVQSLKVHAGDQFSVKLADFMSTGYSWFFEAQPTGATMLSNTTGGGDDEPPFILCKFATTKSLAGGDLSWVHVHPWERKDPKADKGHAVVHLEVQKGADNVLVI
mmetsp:Transcript_52313/g.117805  ORF Transcript_52313/g.117805 Transcript_52313/m.117805 type:complete len:136 (+) Transcript_52313:94-501(+)|eukprot:CAMPEP_0197891524 /NCGR_PEP_ID=MMETSP1439-20131203/28825_1 /TAXON_ID=66791 /ORGANISM="Gonyaulax spinifera, Strain CCMP409" /LENGTH=135 /DNA_ID=CAMNT_0043511633 /DNA_START=84 /DNA_END=491 /DNA_ORIENTATION=+